MIVTSIAHGLSRKRSFIMKKVFATIICFIIATAVAISASAAGLDANKQKVLDALKEKVTANGKTYSVPADLITQAENYLKRDDVTITADQADAIVEQIEAAAEIVKKAGVSTAAELSAAEKTALLEKINAAAEVVNLTVSVDSAKGKITVLSGNELVASDEGAIKFTGVDVSYLVVLAASVVALLTGCYVAARRMRLFSR